MRRKPRKADPEKLVELTEDEYIFLDGLMIMLRFVGHKTPNLEHILKPIAMDLFDRFYQNHDLPDGEVTAVNLDPKPGRLISDLTGGRFH